MTVLFHYSNEKFEGFDLSQCDGVWLTDIKPTDTEMLDEIGAAGMRYAAIVEVDIDSLDSLDNGDNYDVEQQLECSGADFIHNMYDGFEDYAFSNVELLRIVEWVELMCE